MAFVEIEGTRLQVACRAKNLEDMLERAVSAYLDRTHQPNHAKVRSRRIDGWCRDYRRYDVYAETDTDSGRGRRHRYFEVTVYQRIP
ncbi:hypothetical protein [Flindersiella endophytica]